MKKVFIMDEEDLDRIQSYITKNTRNIEAINKRMDYDADKDTVKYFATELHYNNMCLNSMINDIR